MLAGLVALALEADAERLPVKTYTAADGLPSDTVSRLRQDSRGFLWLVAGDGISRFDGHEFTNYTTDDGLPDRRVNDLLETRQGVYWVGTHAGLARFDPTGVRGSSSPPFVALPLGKPLAVTRLLESEGGGILCGTAEGLYLLEAEARRWRPVGAGKVTGDVTFLFRDRKGSLWVGTRHGALHRLAADGAVERFDHGHGLPLHQLLTSMVETAEGHLWVGTKGGLCRLVDSPDPSRAVVARTYTARDGLASSWVMALSVARDGRLFAATTAGLCLLVPAAAPAPPAFRVYGTRQGLCDQDVLDLAGDRDGNLWVASRCGAAKVVPNGFTRYGADDGLSTLNIASILEDQSGGLIAVEHGGNIGASPSPQRIHRFDGTRFTGVTPRLPPSTYSGWGWAQTTLQDRAGDWWIPTGMGLRRFRGLKRFADLARTEPTLVSGAGGGLAKADVFRLFEDSRGAVWIATTGVSAGLWRWERETDTAQDITPQTGVRPGSDFTAFREDAAGQLWIGSSDGLLRYAAGRFQRFTAADGVPAGWILSLLLDRSGRIWIASQLGGLGRIDDPAGARPVIRRFTTADGLSSNNIRCLAEDERGLLYLGTSRGVDRLDPKTLGLKRYTSADGLPQGSIEVSHRDRHGALWFGSSFGLSRFVPGAPAASPPPFVAITGLRIAGVPQRVSSLGELEPPRLSLKPSEGHVSIDVVGLGASLGEELRYQYRLADAERDWSAPTSEHTVSYARLAPGRYRFQARALSADGQASRLPATFAFTIASPLWMRWWFWATLALALGSAAAAFYRYRVARLLEVVAMRTRIATDLHDDIGANLTRISILSDVARRQLGDDDPDSDRPLASISRIARESVSSMGDIVWAIDPRRDSLLDLVRRMRRHAEEVFDSGTELTIEAPDAERDLRLGAGVRRDVLLIFKEAVNNAVRHARPSRVAIAFRVDGPRLTLSVADDGAGFDTSVSAEGQGLLSMRRRAAALGGELAVRSSPGQGTAVTLAVSLSAGRSYLPG